MFAIQFSLGSWPRQIPRVHQSHLPVCWSPASTRCDAGRGLQPVTWHAPVLEVRDLQVLSSVWLHGGRHGVFFSSLCSQTQAIRKHTAGSLAKFVGLLFVLCTMLIGVVTLAGWAQKCLIRTCPYHRYLLSGTRQDWHLKVVPCGFQL